MRERFVRIAAELLDTDPRVAVLLADISADAFEAARRRHPARVVNVGIREQLLISVAGGMALAGMRPIAHTFASFLVERPFEQIKLDLNHQGAGAVLVSSGASFDYSSSGRTHQSPGDVALLGTVPGWTVHVPGHPAEAERVLRAATDSGRSGTPQGLRPPSGYGRAARRGRTAGSAGAAHARGGSRVLTRPFASPTLVSPMRPRRRLRLAAASPPLMDRGCAARHR